MNRMVNKSDVDKVLKDKINRELARKKLIEFVKYTDPNKKHPDRKYQVQDYHIEISEKLEKLYRWDIKKLMISVPPQHWKSTLSSVNFPAWVLWQKPETNIAVWSYAMDLSEWFSRSTRALLKSNSYSKIFGDVIDPNATSVKERKTNKAGMYKAVGVGSGLTGRPVDLMIIDDVHKDREEADSTRLREKTWDWYTSVVLSRLNVNSRQLILMTRWHEDDLIGRILDKESEEWEIVNIPVYNEDWSTIRPDRFPPEFIEKKRKTIWEREFQSLYMWDPISEWWWIFKRKHFQKYRMKEMPSDVEIYGFIDPAISKKQEADYTAFVTVWYDPLNNDIYIIDIVNERLDPSEIIDTVFEKHKLYKHRSIWIEIVQYQKMLAQEFKKQMKSRDYFFTLREIRPQGEKEARISSTLEPRYSTHTVRHLNRHYELETQLMKFPNWKHDDMIDALASVVAMIQTQNTNKDKDWVIRSNWF